jgi:hypothetical protein
MSEADVIKLPFTDGRKETWEFPDGTMVTMERPTTEPPITVKDAVYCFSSILHGLHAAMLG